MTEPTPAPTEVPTPTLDAAPEVAPKTFTEDYVKELRAEAAKYRNEAKTAKAEADKARAATLTEAEQAVEAVKAETRTAVLREIGGKLVDAELRAAAAGRPIQVDALLEAVDRGRFITDDGDVDRKALAAWVDRIAPASEPAPTPVPSFDGGIRTPASNNSTASQFAKAIGNLLP